MKTCQTCGQPLVRKVWSRGERESTTKFNARRYCDQECAKPARTRALTRGSKPRNHAELLEDLEWIIGTDHPDNIARRLGYSNAENLERVLHKWRRPDLAARVRVVAA